MAGQDEVMGIVEKLIDACRDSEKGYRDAAEHISDPELRGFFHDQSAERAEFAAELQQALHGMGKWETTRQGSVAGALRRAWVGLQSTLGAGDQGILDAAEAAEDDVKRAYEEALQQPFPDDLRAMVEKQAMSVRAAHDHVRLVRDRRKAA